MTDELFWTIFGAIGTTIGSIATALAVVVALWQTKFSNKKRLKLKFNEPITLMQSSTGQKVGEYIGVSITNIGNREIIIADWSILYSNKKDKRRIKIMTDLQGLLKVTLPHHLPIEQNLDLSYERQHFIKLVSELVEKKEANPKRKIKFQIMDTTGKKYFTYSKYSALVYAEEYTENQGRADCT